jgi:outer membrane lipase/esterase
LILAQAVNSLITGPQQIGTLGEAPFGVEQANFRAVDGRMWSAVNTPRVPNKFEAWAVYDYGHTDLVGDGSAHINTIAVGGDAKVSDKLLVGLMFGYSEERGDFGGTGGDYKLRQPVGTVYAGYGEGPWYLGATLGAGDLDYSNITRTIPLGPAVRTETGDTRGYEFTARLLGGYWFQYADILHGPHVRVEYTKATVHAFCETGNDSLALCYGEQKPDSLLWTVGWQATGNIGAVRPWARVAWQYDSLADTRNISASSAALGGNYTIPLAKTDNNYALFNLGASADFGRVTGFVYGSATAGRSDGNYYAITVGIRAPL